MVTLVRKLCHSNEYKTCIVEAQIINQLQASDWVQDVEKSHPSIPWSIWCHIPRFQKENGSVYFIYSKLSSGAGFMLLDVEI